MAILFAIVAMVGWAVGDTIIAHTSRKIGNRTAMFLWLLFGTLISSFYIPFAGAISHWGMLGAAVLLGWFLCVGTLFYFRAFEVGNASITAVIGGSNALLTVLLAVLFFGENLTVLRFAGIGFILVGLTLASVRVKELIKLSRKGFLSDPAVLPAFVAFFAWGTYWAVVRIPIDSIGWFWTGYAAWFFFPLMPLLGLVKLQSVHVIRKPSTFAAVFFMSLLTAVAGFAANLGISAGYISVVTPIANSFPVLLVILTRVFFKEPLTRTQTAGIIISLLGIVLVSLS